MRRVSTVVFCVIDAFLPLRGKILPGFEEFSADLSHAGVPVVWVTNRSRAELGEPRSTLGHNHPFIAEGGCGVYLPEDYFHLRPSKTVRLGRFMCIPIADTQPAASEALIALVEETGISIVPLRSLSPREFAQNSGLSPREGELARQRDFEELFFFAGASDEHVRDFLGHVRRRKLQLRQRGALWSLAVGSNLGHCLGELSSLYDRSLRAHALTFGLATEESEELLATCDRGVLLYHQGQDGSHGRRQIPKIRKISLSAPDVWDQVRAMIAPTE